MSIYEINFCLICNLFCAISDYKTYEKILGQFLDNLWSYFIKSLNPLFYVEHCIRTYILTTSFTLALYFTFSFADCSDCTFISDFYFFAIFLFTYCYFLSIFLSLSYCSSLLAARPPYISHSQFSGFSFTFDYCHLILASFKSANVLTIFFVKLQHSFLDFCHLTNFFQVSWIFISIFFLKL